MTGIDAQAEVPAFLKAEVEMNPGEREDADQIV